jgi:hypothetical protein
MVQRIFSGRWFLQFDVVRFVFGFVVVVGKRGSERIRRGNSLSTNTSLERRVLD